MVAVCFICFVHPIFGFWFLVTFGNKVTKIWKYYVIFVYILQCKLGKMEKTRKENHATKVTKVPKTKIWDERNSSEEAFSYIKQYIYGVNLWKKESFWKSITCNKSLKSYAYQLHFLWDCLVWKRPNILVRVYMDHLYSIVWSKGHLQMSDIHACFPLIRNVGIDNYNSLLATAAGVGDVAQNHS